MIYSNESLRERSSQDQEDAQGFGGGGRDGEVIKEEVRNRLVSYSKTIELLLFYRHAFPF